MYELSSHGKSGVNSYRNAVILHIFCLFLNRNLIAKYTNLKFIQKFKGLEELDKTFLLLKDERKEYLKLLASSLNKIQLKFTKMKNAILRDPIFKVQLEKMQNSIKIHDEFSAELDR